MKHWNEDGWWDGWARGSQRVLRCGHRCAGRSCGPRAGEGWCGAGLPPHTSTGEEDAEARSLTPTHRTERESEGHCCQVQQPTQSGTRDSRVNPQHRWTHSSWGSETALLRFSDSKNNDLLHFYAGLTGGLHQENLQMKKKVKKVYCMITGVVIVNTETIKNRLFKLK